MKTIKTLLSKVKQFKLTTPLAIIIASIIFSFHYVWINKYEFVPNKHGKTSFTVINKWTGKACMAFVDMDDRDAIEYRVPALCDSESRLLFGDSIPFNHDIELP